MKNKLGNLIKEKREKKGISKIELAKKIDINKSSMYRIENGEFKKPSIEILLSLSNELDIPFDKLLLLAGYEVTKYKKIFSKLFFVNDMVIELNDKIYDKVISVIDGNEIIDIEKVLNCYKNNEIDLQTTIKLINNCNPIDLNDNIIYQTENGNIIIS